MKKTLQRLASFATFNLPLNAGYNKLLLRAIHQQNNKAIPYWNVEGTRRKLIAYYWYQHILYNFLALFGVAFIITLPLTQQFAFLHLSVLCLIGCLAF